MRRGLAWLVAVPIVFAGMESAHAVANGLCGSPDGSGELFAAAGSGAALLVPLVALATGSLLVGLVTRVAGAWRGSVGGRGRALSFGLLPVAVFVVLEAAEGAVNHHGRLPWREFADPTFAVGLAMQLPFAAAAYLLASGLLRVSDAVRRVIAGRGPSRQTPRATVAVRRPTADRARSAPDFSAGYGRAPPGVLGSG